MRDEGKGKIWSMRWKDRTKNKFGMKKKEYGCSVCEIARKERVWKKESEVFVKKGKECGRIKGSRVGRVWL